MKTIAPLSAFDKIKLLSDARRLAILRLLMSEPATLSQLGRALGKHPAWIQHHMKALEAGDLVEVAEVRVTAGVIEKYYRAKASGFFLQELILPQTDKPVMVFSGSHDLAIEQLSAQLARHVEILVQPVGSLDGLVNLRQGLCHLAGSHLLDATGEYNTPLVRRLFPDRPVHLITLAHRTQGWMVASGNPLGLRGAADLTRPNLRFVNRNPGSGTRAWLDAELQRLGIPLASVSGYDHSVSTHTEAAEAVQNGGADIALGLEAAALQHGLDFIPLFAERYDLIFPHEFTTQLNPVLDYLQSGRFRQLVGGLSGYETAHTGDEVRL